jgi:hypothetical protein
MKICLPICFFLFGVLRCYAAFETEPNDSLAAANSITPGQNTTGQLASANDQDWFGFSMSSAGSVNVVFSSPEVSTIFFYHTVQVRNAAGTIFASVDTGQDASFQTGLPSAGTYFLVVRDGPHSTLSTGQYAISITTSGPQSNVESEPNNTFDTASPLPISLKVSGQLSSVNDQDWFSFTTAGSGGVTLTFDSPEASSIFFYHTVHLRNAAGTIFASVDTGQDASFQTGLPSAGTYYVVVRDGPHSTLSTGQYGLTVTTTAPPAPAVVQAQIYTAVEVVWNSTVGKSYVVEWSPNMSANSWFPLSPAYAGTAGTMSYLDSIRGKTKAFYRVKEN